MKDNVIRAITFDVGGTLLQPWPSVGDVYAAAAERCGVSPPDASDLTRTFLRAWQRKGAFDYSTAAWKKIVTQTFGETLPLRAADRVFQAVYKAFALPEAWRVYDDVRPVLSALRQAGFRLGIVSNWDERLRPLLDALDLTRVFDVIIVSCEAGATKPHPAIFQRAVETLRLAPGEILHVGDGRSEDFRGARQTGLTAAWLRRGHQHRPWPELASLLHMLPALEKNS